MNRSILDIDAGNIIRLIDNELEKVIININDKGTDEKAREITCKIKLKPSKNRDTFAVSYVVSSKTSPKNNEPVIIANTQVFDEKTGEYLGSKLTEVGGTVPGQLNLDGKISPPKSPVLVGQKLIQMNKESIIENKDHQEES